MSTAALTKQMLTLPQLKELLRQPDRIVGELSSLLLTLADPVEETRAYAADCLQTIESIDPGTANEIVPLCDHENEFVVYWTVATLGKLSSVTPYQTQLTHALKNHGSLTVRQAAAMALRSAKGASPETLAALQQAATSPDPRLKRLAQQTLTEIG